MASEGPTSSLNTSQSDICLTFMVVNIQLEMRRAKGSKMEASSIEERGGEKPELKPTGREGS